MLRQVRFRRQPGIGPRDTLPEETLPLDRFLLQLPMLLATEDRPPIPPLSILNQILAEGEESAGMGGGVRWSPFRIGPREYVEAVVALCLRGAYAFDPPPHSVRSLRDWKVWKLEALHNVPEQTFRAGLSRTPDDPVRTEADDALLEIAKAYCYASREQNDHAIHQAERSLQAFLGDDERSWPRPGRTG